MFQICCSVFAGVYNEHIIKNVAGEKVDIMLQNAYMYIDSILCNLFLIACQHFFYQTADASDAPMSINLKSLLQGFVIAIIVNNAAIGIVTSLFLKTHNSIIKAFASALELVFTAILSFIILGIPIYWNTAIAVAVVSSAVVMYAQNPLKSTTNANSEGGNSASEKSHQNGNDHKV